MYCLMTLKWEYGADVAITIRGCPENVKKKMNFRFVPALLLRNESFAFQSTRNGIDWFGTWALRAFLLSLLCEKFLMHFYSLSLSSLPSLSFKSYFRRSGCQSKHFSNQNVYTQRIDGRITMGKLFFSVSRWVLHTYISSVRRH